MSDQPAGTNKSLGAVSPKITVETLLPKSTTAVVDFNYTITGPTDQNTKIVWTWGDGTKATKDAGTLATGAVSSGKEIHQYSTAQNFYNYTAEIKNSQLPDTITQAQASGTVNVSSDVKAKQTIANITPEIGNYLPVSDKTEVALKYRVDGEYLKPFDKAIWDFGDGEKKEFWGNTLFVNSDELIAHSYTKPGTYNYSLTLKKADGSEIAKKSDSVTLEDSDFDALPKQTITSCTKEPNSSYNKYNVSWSKTESPIIDHYVIKSKLYLGISGNQETYNEITIAPLSSPDNLLKKISGGSNYAEGLNGTTGVFNFGEVDVFTIFAVSKNGRKSQSSWYGCD